VVIGPAGYAHHVSLPAQGWYYRLSR
jgi:hypothetical protein